MIHLKIRKLREEMGFTQESMAECLFISQNAYSLIEQGKTKLDVDRLLQIAEKLNVSATILIDNKLLSERSIAYGTTTNPLKNSLELKDRLIHSLIQQNSFLLSQIKKMNSTE